MSRVVVVGSLNLDLAARVARLPAPGETIQAHGFATHPGGKGGNQAVAAARLGAEVHMVGRVGRDAAGEQLREALLKAGVYDRAVLTTEGPSGTALITADDAGENSIVVVPGANALLTPEDVDAHEQLLGSAALVLLQLEIPLVTVERVADICLRHGVPVMLDPAPASPLSSSLLRKVAWLTPNETESEALLGEGARQGEQACAAALLGRGARNVVLKLGSRGAWLAGTDAEPGLITPFRVQATDTTAAGDAFNGAFTCGLAEGRPAREAARRAAAAAALSTTRPGAQSSMATLSEVEALLREQP